MTTQNYDLAAAYIAALTGSPDTPVDFRVLSDRDAGAQGHVRRGTLRDCWEWLCAMNDQHYGVFMVCARTDGAGQKMQNVQAVRAAYVDLDGPDARQQLDRIAAAQPAPSFAVETSPSKYHVFWCVPEHSDLQRHTTLQRKLATLYHGDPKVTDATRVLRLAGTVHHKTETPWLVPCWALPGYTTGTTIEALEAATKGVTVPDAGSGARVPLGASDQAAPTIQWLSRALELCDPSELGRDEWLAFTAGFKQAGWTLAPEGELRAMWDAWCARYSENDLGANDKLWRSVTDSELGWKSLCRRVPSLQAALSFSGAQAPTAITVPVTPMPSGAPAPLDCSGPYLTHLECAEWFKGCTFVTDTGSILTPDGRFLSSTQFNGKYGGKRFIIDGENNRTTDEAWKAALRSTLWKVPVVDHVRFLPHLPHGAITDDDLGRKGVNTYKPAVVSRVEGDVSPFLRHLALLLPDEGDQRILLDYMAHNVKYPGHKIPWAPVIQSTEGAGKGVFKRIMRHALGGLYVHEPNAKELTSSGSQFNGWLRNKLFIIADEIKVDDKRDLIEVLKPLISEEWIEIQSKGVDQRIEDSFSNWLFFTNWKDAIPINANGRRYAIFYSALQSREAKPPETYYKALYDWVRGDGAAIVTDWLLKHPIERGAIPMDAPRTSSYEEALRIGQSPIERSIREAVVDGHAGFKGGWVSSIAVLKRVKDTGVIKGSIAPQTLNNIMEQMGYRDVGRADRPWHLESMFERATLFWNGSGVADVRDYGQDQGYE